MTTETRRNWLALFVIASLLGGIGGFAGSVLGNAFGRSGLFAGGFVGGVLTAPLTGWIAAKRGWIEARRQWPVAAGAALGFLAAATLAINTLSSPVGPVIATTLTGLGALAGARLG
jgi:hypothetical protein